MIQTLTGHTGGVLSLTVLQNGYLASGSYQVISVWNSTNGELIQTFIGHTERVFALTVL